MLKMFIEIFLFPILVVQLIFTGPLLMAQEAQNNSISIKDQLIQAKKSGRTHILDTSAVKADYVTKPQTPIEESLAQSYIKAAALNDVVIDSDKRLALPEDIKKQNSKKASTAKPKFDISLEEIYEARAQSRKVEAQMGPLTKSAAHLTASLAETKEVFAEWSKKLQFAAASKEERLKDSERAITYSNKGADFAHRMLRTPRHLMVLFSPSVQAEISAEFERRATFVQKKSLAIETFARDWKEAFLKVAQTKLGPKTYNSSLNTINDIAEQTVRAAKTSIKASSGFASQSAKASITTARTSFKFLKTWGIETLFFNSAAYLASWTQASLDASFNPLHFQQWQDAWSDPAGHLGFGAFIAANHSYQNLLRKLPSPMAQRLLSPLGMGVGMSASHVVSGFLHHPAFKAWWYAPVNHPDASVAAKAKVVREYAAEVMFYEFTSSRYWRSMVDDIGSLLLASTFAGVAIAGGKFVGKGAQIAMNSTGSQLMKSQKFAKAAKVAASTRVVVTVKDGINAAKLLIPGTWVLKLTHFTFFLLADPLARQVVNPISRQTEIGSAQQNYKKVLNLSSKYQQYLDETVIFDRRTESIKASKAASTESQARAFKYLDVMGGNLPKPGKSLFHFRENKAIYDAIDAYFAGKKEFRTLVTMDIEAKRMAWMDYLKTFKEDEETGKAVFNYIVTSMQSKLNNNESYSKDRLPGKQLIADNITNDFLPNFYYALPQDSRDLVRENLRELSFNETKIGKNSLNYLQADLVEQFPENSKVNWGRATQGSFNGSTADQIIFANKALEAPIKAMIFGPQVKKYSVFDLDKGEYPKFYFPSILNEDASPNSLKTKLPTPISKVNLPKGGSIDVYEFLGINYLDPQDSVYKNPLQYIMDNLHPDLLPSEEHNVTAEEWYRLYVSCRPGWSLQEYNQLKEDAITNMQKSRDSIREENYYGKRAPIQFEIPEMECSEGSINAAYKKYSEIYQDFALREIGALYGDIQSHQSQTTTNYIFNHSLGLDDTFLGVNGANKFNLNADKVNSDELSVGNTNPILSAMEDIVVGLSMLKHLVTKSDLDSADSLDHIPVSGSTTKPNNKLTSQEDLDFAKFVDEEMAEILFHISAALVETKANKAHSHIGMAQKALDRIETKVNSYTCSAIQGKNIDNTFKVLDENTNEYIYFHYEQVYNDNTKKYDLILSQLDRLDYCAENQVRKKHEFFVTNYKESEKDIADKSHVLVDPNSQQTYATMSRFDLATLKNSNQFKDDAEILLFLMSNVSQSANKAVKENVNLKDHIADFNFEKEISTAFQLTQQNDQTLSSYSLLAPPAEVNQALILSEYVETTVKNVKNQIKNPSDYGNIILQMPSSDKAIVNTTARTANASLILNRISKLVSDELFSVHYQNIIEYTNALSKKKQALTDILPYSVQQEVSEIKLNIPVFNEICKFQSKLSDKLILNNLSSLVTDANEFYEQIVDVLDRPEAYTPNEVIGAQSFYDRYADLAVDESPRAMIAAIAAEKSSDYMLNGYCEKEDAGQSFSESMLNKVKSFFNK